MRFKGRVQKYNFPEKEVLINQKPRNNATQHECVRPGQTPRALASET